jgi:hypothetical protein
MLSSPALIALSIVIGEATDWAGSLVIAVTLHSWIDVLFEVPRLVDGPAWPTYLVFVLSLILWSILLWFWPSAPVRGSAVE